MKWQRLLTTAFFYGIRLTVLSLAGEQPLTLHVEELMRGLKEKYCIVIVNHNMQQAARVSDHTGFMLLGVLKEFGTTKQTFTNPRQADTENCISGRFG